MTTYKDAGVDIDAGNAFVHKIKPLVDRTTTKGVVGDLGGFNGMFELTKKYNHPVLVSGTDGVGTKLKLATKPKHHKALGIDLVAMCVNDIICSGADPLFMLDYIATDKLDYEKLSSVIAGLAEGCIESNCAIIGGETAEMPGMYAAGDYDLAGFVVGAVEKKDIIKNKVPAGKILIGLRSSGVHSNGFSLIRNILGDDPVTPDFLDELLTPTKIYYNAIKDLLLHVNVLGISHITGGGLTENVPRILADHVVAKIDDRSWDTPDVFNSIQAMGSVSDEEMYKTFNMGIGMVIAISPNDLPKAIFILESAGEDPVFLGNTIKYTEATPKTLII